MQFVACFTLLLSIVHFVNCQLVEEKVGEQITIHLKCQCGHEGSLVKTTGNPGQSNRYELYTLSELDGRSYCSQLSEPMEEVFARMKPTCPECESPVPLEPPPEVEPPPIYRLGQAPAPEETPVSLELLRNWMTQSMEAMKARR